MRVILELIRIILIFGLLGGLFSTMLNQIYDAVGVHTIQYRWLGFIAILLSLFVLYRNKLQFSGWYNGKGKGKEKLPSKITYTLVSCSILLVLLPIIINYWMFHCF